MTTCPIAQVGCASASAIVTSLKSRRFLNGPPLAVKTNLEISDFLPAIALCQIALCSESTGINWFSAARDITNSPAATSDSLFANANLFPTSSAASVGPSPIEPVMPFKTTSQVIAAISLAAFGPSITATPGRASRITSAFITTPIT